MPIDLAEIEQHAPTVASLLGPADAALHNLGLADHDAHVVIAVDLARSNRAAVADGTMHLALELIYALGLRFDTDAQVPVIGFGNEIVDIGEMTLGNAEDFFTTQMPEFDHTHTDPEKLIEWIGSGGFDFADGLPVLILVITDGSSFDQPSEGVLHATRELVGMPVFVQFIGHSAGDGSFNLMRSLDEQLHQSSIFQDHIGFSMWPRGVVVTEPLVKDVLSEYARWVANRPAN